MPNERDIELAKAMDNDPRFAKGTKAKQAKQSKKGFQAYNWTTIEKVHAGQRKAIKTLKEKDSLTDAEKITLTRLESLNKWSTAALRLHKEGKSDKTIRATLQAQAKQNT